MCRSDRGEKKLTRGGSKRCVFKTLSSTTYNLTNGQPCIMDFLRRVRSIWRQKGTFILLPKKHVGMWIHA